MSHLFRALIFSACCIAFFPAAAHAERILGPNGLTNECRKDVQTRMHVTDEGARHLPVGWKFTIGTTKHELKRGGTIWTECRNAVRSGTTFQGASIAPVVAAKPAAQTVAPVAAKPHLAAPAPAPAPAVKALPAPKLQPVPKAPLPEAATASIPEPVPSQFSGNTQSDAAYAADAAADAKPYVSPYEQTLRENHYKDNSLRTSLIDFMHNVKVWLQDNLFILIVVAVVGMAGVIAFLVVKFFRNRNDDFETPAELPDDDAEDRYADSEEAADDYSRQPPPTAQTSGLIFDNRSPFQRMKEGPLDEQFPIH